MAGLKHKTRLWWWLLPLMVLLVALAANHLENDLMWIDELYSVGNIGAVYRVPLNPVEIWNSVEQNSPQHVPGYFFLLSGWAALVGWSPFALRVLSLGFGLLAIVWTYRIGSDWFSARAGLYAAIVLGVGAFFVYFTHEIRMYTMVVALTAYVLWFYQRVTTPTHHPKWWEWGLFFVGTLSLIYTHTIGAIPLAAIGIYHVLFVRKDRRWWMVMAVFAATVLLFLPWVSILLAGAQYGSRGDAALSPRQIVKTVAVLFSNGHPLVLALVLFSGLVGLVGHWRRSGQLWFLFLVMLVLTIVMNEVTRIITPNRPRYLLPLWPVLALMIGVGLKVIEGRARWLVPPLLGIWVLLGMVDALDPEFLSFMDGPRFVEDYPPLTEIVDEVNMLSSPGDFLVTFAEHPHVFERYKFISIGEYYFHDLDVNSYNITLPDPRPEPEIEQALLDAVGRRLAVWFAYEPGMPEATLQVYRDILSERYQRCALALDQPDLRIERYDYAPFACLTKPPTSMSMLNYQEGIMLDDLRIEQGSDGVLRMAAAWDIADTVPPNTYSVSFKLWPDDSPQSTFVAQVDYGLRDAGFGWQLGEIPLADLPAGNYMLTAAVYDWRQGPRLMATAAGGARGEELPVADLHIDKAGAASDS